MLHEIYSRMALPPQIHQIWVLGKPVICLIHLSEALTVLYLYVYLLVSVGLELYCF